MTFADVDLGYLLEVRPWLSFGTIAAFLMFVAFPVLYHVFGFCLHLFQIIAAAIDFKSNQSAINEQWSENMLSNSIEMAAAIIFFTSVLGGIMTFFQPDVAWHLTSGFRLFPIEEIHLIIFNIAMLFAGLTFAFGLLHMLRIAGPWFPVVIPAYLTILLLFGFIGLFAGPLGLIFLYKFYKHEQGWADGIILPIRSGLEIIMKPSLIRERPYNCLLMATRR